MRCWGFRGPRPRVPGVCGWGFRGPWPRVPRSAAGSSGVCGLESQGSAARSPGVCRWEFRGPWPRVPGGPWPEHSPSSARPLMLQAPLGPRPTSVPGRVRPTGWCRPSRPGARRRTDQGSPPHLRPQSPLLHKSSRCPAQRLPRPLGTVREKTVSLQGAHAFRPRLHPFPGA